MINTKWIAIFKNTCFNIFNFILGRVLKPYQVYPTLSFRWNSRLSEKSCSLSLKKLIFYVLLLAGYRSEIAWFWRKNLLELTSILWNYFLIYIIQKNCRSDFRFDMIPFLPDLFLSLVTAPVVKTITGRIWLE